MTPTPDDDLCLNLIRRHLDDNGYPPTVRWLAGELNEGTSAVHRRLERLTNTGRITRDPNTARGIRIVPAPPIVFRFPPPDEILSINKVQHFHPMKRHTHVKIWRNAGKLWWLKTCGRGPRNLPPSTVHLAFAARGDPHNYVATIVKYIVDGMVDAGAWPNDTAPYVTVIEPTLDKTLRDVTVTVTPR